MAGHDSLRFPLAALLILGLAGCRGTPQPVTRAAEPAPPSAAPTAAPTPQPTPAQTAPTAPPAREGEAAPVVVDPGTQGDGPPETLVEAARAERERRAAAGKPIAVITNKTLPKYAREGQLTIAEPTTKEKGKPDKTSAAGAPVKDEQYWRSQARQLRETWRQDADEVKDLEQQSAKLRQKFYLESDTFIRDTQIKPEWDRVLDRLRQARLDVDAAKQELAKFLEEGRTAGAQPGWLDEGIENEPADENATKKETPPVQSIEPPVINDDAIRTPPPGLAAHDPEALR